MRILVYGEKLCVRVPSFVCVRVSFISILSFIIQVLARPFEVEGGAATLDKVLGATEGLVGSDIARIISEVSQSCQVSSH